MGTHSISRKPGRIELNREIALAIDPSFVYTNANQGLTANVIVTGTAWPINPTSSTAATTTVSFSRTTSQRIIGIDWS